MYKVGVIGLGHIAAMYETPESKNPYCHVGGILKSSNVKLTKVADMSEEARVKFRSVWGDCFSDLQYYDSSQKMLDSKDLDIIAVCVRGPHHFQVMMEALAASPKAVFLEKPPSCSLAEMDQMMRMAAAKNIPITVSYSRHWNLHMLKMQELVKKGLIGQVKTVIGYCGGTVLSFASHTTDLICQFAGYCPSTVYASGEILDQAPAGFESEPSLTHMVIHFENGVTGIQVGANGEHGAFYCEVFGTKGSLRVGMYTDTVVRTTNGELVDLTPYHISERESVFTTAYDQIANHLNGGPLPDCTNDDFVTVNEIGFAAIESIYTGKVVELPNRDRTRKIFANG